MASVLRKIIFTPDAPKPVGPYSQAVQVGNTVYVSGCLGMDKDTMKLVEGGVGPQTKKALQNLVVVLKKANSSLDKVVKTTIFLESMNDFVYVNEIYKESFKEPFPARSTFQVGKLPMGARVEIEVIAISGDIVDEVTTKAP